MYLWGWGLWSISPGSCAHCRKTRGGRLCCFVGQIFGCQKFENEHFVVIQYSSFVKHNSIIDIYVPVQCLLLAVYDIVWTSSDVNGVNFKAQCECNICWPSRSLMSCSSRLSASLHCAWTWRRSLASDLLMWQYYDVGVVINVRWHVGNMQVEQIFFHDIPSPKLQ